MDPEAKKVADGLHWVVGNEPQYGDDFLPLPQDVADRVVLPAGARARFTLWEPVLSEKGKVVWVGPVTIRELFATFNRHVALMLLKHRCGHVSEIAGDHVFFEGLTEGGAGDDGVMGYFMYMGS